jgi:hypothetical protein
LDSEDATGTNYIDRPEHIKRSHTLRYVLKNRKTDTVYLVVLFTLYLKEDVNEDGSIKEGVVGGKPHVGTAKGVEAHDDYEKHGEHENVHENGYADAGTAVQKGVVETSEDDVD